MNVQYERGETGVGYSPSIWARVLPVHVWDGSILLTGDNFPHLTPSGDKYTIRETDDKVSVTLLATEMGGVARLGITGDDNEEVNLCYSQGEGGVIAQIVRNSRRRLFFEVRFRLSNILADTAAIFLGLTEEATAAAEFQVDDTGAPKDMDYVGFRNLHTNGGADVNANLDAAYRTNGGAEAVAQEAAQVMVASTWYKAGFVFDGLNTINYYVDGSYVGTNAANATLFPDGERLTFAAGLKMGSDAAANLDIDWWRCAMELETLA